jgi:hypothetical protein
MIIIMIKRRDPTSPATGALPSSGGKSTGGGKGVWGLVGWGFHHRGAGLCRVQMCVIRARVLKAFLYSSELMGLRGALYAGVARRGSWRAAGVVGP